MADGHFEARLTAKRETAAGIFVTVQIQPDDYKAELATLRVGSALVLAWAEVVDTSVQPIEITPAVAESVDARPSGRDESRAGASPVRESTKDRKPFASLPLSQQCAMRCSEKPFQEYMCYTFWNTNVDEPTEEYTAILVRNHLSVESRSELKDNYVAQTAWLELERRYQDHLTDQRYADAQR